MFNNVTLRIAPEIDSSAGSTKDHYTATVKLPYECEKCMLAVFDQRKWGTCIDLKVLTEEQLTAPPKTYLGWVPKEDLLGITEAMCVAPYYEWERNYSALASGFKGAPAHW